MDYDIYIDFDCCYKNPVLLSLKVVDSIVTGGLMSVQYANGNGSIGRRYLPVSGSLDFFTASFRFLCGYKSIFLDGSIHNDSLNYYIYYLPDGDTCETLTVPVL